MNGRVPGIFVVVYLAHGDPCRSYHEPVAQENIGGHDRKREPDFQRSAVANLGEAQLRTGRFETQVKQDNRNDCGRQHERVAAQLVRHVIHARSL